jgi:hypothetical protein
MCSVGISHEGSIPLVTLDKWGYDVAVGLPELALAFALSAAMLNLCTAICNLIDKYFQPAQIGHKKTA